MRRREVTKQAQECVALLSEGSTESALEALPLSFPRSFRSSYLTTPVIFWAVWRQQSHEVYSASWTKLKQLKPWVAM
ncbi:MAG TPA: hypothetical protein G4O12_04615 [Dehalococcoidia bacterium]|nr:hypothetical protein [Dehalococcoidia bacterium]